MAAAGMRMLGAGSPAAAPLPARARVRALGPSRGGRHDRAACRDRPHARRAARAVRARCSTRSAPSYERWDGRGWPGELEGDAVPLAARHRAGRGVRRGGEPGRRRGRRRGGWRASGAAGSSTRRVCDLIEAEAEVILSGPRHVGTWDAVIEAEPALAVVRLGRALRRRAARRRELRRPEVALLPRPRAGGGRPGRRGGRAARARRGRRSATLRRAGLVHDLGRLGVSNAIWDKPRPAGRRRVGAASGSSRTSPSACCASPRRSRRWPRIAVQHRERLDGSGYPRGLSGAGDLAASAHPRRRRRLPGDARAAPAPPGALGRGGGGRAARRGAGRAARRRGGRGRARRGGPQGAAPARGAGGPHPARGRGPEARSRAGCRTRRSPSGS